MQGKSDGCGVTMWNGTTCASSIDHMCDVQVQPESLTPSCDAFTVDMPFAAGMAGEVRKTEGGANTFGFIVPLMQDLPPLSAMIPDEFVLQWVDAQPNLQIELGDPTFTIDTSVATPVATLEGLIPSDAFRRSAIYRPSPCPTNASPASCARRSG